MSAANPPATFGDIGTLKEVLKMLVMGPDFERELVKVEARFADGLTLERLPAAAVSTSELEGMPVQFPFLEIVGPGSDPDVQIDYADANTHAIDMIFWATGDDEQTVTKKCERYLLATRKLIRNERLMPLIGCRPVVRGRESYGVVGRQKGTTGPFVKAAAIAFSVSTIEADDQ